LVLSELAIIFSPAELAEDVSIIFSLIFKHFHIFICLPQWQRLNEIAINFIS